MLQIYAYVYALYHYICLYYYIYYIVIYWAYIHCILTNIPLNVHLHFLYRLYANIFLLGYSIKMKAILQMVQYYSIIVHALNPVKLSLPVG